MRHASITPSATVALREGARVERGPQLLDQLRLGLGNVDMLARIGAQVDCPDHVMRGRDSPKCSSLLVTQLGQCLAADAAKKRGRRSG